MDIRIYSLKPITSPPWEGPVLGTVGMEMNETRDPGTGAMNTQTNRYYSVVHEADHGVYSRWANPEEGSFHSAEEICGRLHYRS